MHARNGGDDVAVGAGDPEDALKEMVRKLRGLFASLAKLRGSLRSAGLFLPEESSGVWDLVVFAAWLDPENMEHLRFIAGKLQKVLSPEELKLISRIIILGHNGIPWHMQGTEPHQVDYDDFTFNGVRMRRGYLLYSDMSNHKKKPRRSR